jgi:NADH-quinone oxidoreductase subunit L
MVPVLILLTILFPWAGAVLVSIAGDRHPRLQHALAIFFSVVAGVFAVILLLNTLPAWKGIAPAWAAADPYVRIPLGGAFGDFSFLADGLGVYLAAIATVIGGLAVVFSVDYMRGEKQLGRYYAYILVFIGAMAGLVLTASLLFLFFFWEITALCSYALISFNNDDPKAVAGGIKALIITQLGGIGLLLGALIAYATLGTYEISSFLQLGPQIIPVFGFSVAAFGFLVAAAAKSAQFPFQTWLPDAMEAPTPVSALIHAATMVNAGVYLLARFYPAFSGVPGWKEAVIVVGVVSALLAAVMALTADDLKRVLAYSTVSQLGYMVYGIGVGGLFASQVHLLSHSVFKALLFLGAGAVIHAVGTRDMRRMGGLGRRMPFTQIAFIIGALALAGIPILNGFWSKELLLEAGLEEGPPIAYYFMLFIAGLTALYTIRMVSLVFFGRPRSELHAHDAGPAMKISLSLLAFGAFTTWLLTGRFGVLLDETLPFHEVHFLGVRELAGALFAAPATYLALGVVALGLLIGWQRERLAGIGSLLRIPAGWSRDSFGFEWINRQIRAAVRTSADALSLTQTGQLNWNIAGIVLGLVILLTFLALGS